MDIVLAPAPDVLNHNTETVPRLYRQVRLGARYERSLDMLAYAKHSRPQTPVKSGLMLGLGETIEEVLHVMRDLRASKVDILTLGQYLRPSPKHLPIIRYVTPGRVRRAEAARLRDGIPARRKRTAGAQLVSRLGRRSMTSPAPGVTTISLPMPWELESVNVHLIELDEGFLLVDSGIATEECFESLEAALLKRSFAGPTSAFCA